MNLQEYLIKNFDVDVSDCTLLTQAPTVDSFGSAVIDLAATTANQQIVAAPGAGKAIWVYSVAFLFDTAAGTVVFHDSTPTALTGTMAVSDEGGLGYCAVWKFFHAALEVRD